MVETWDFAPLDGITRRVFRNVWFQRFGGVDRCFIPFFSPTPQHILTKRDARELVNDKNLPLVPQIMTRRAEDFIWGAQTAAELGYTEVNLNLGCPSGTVTAKGKGAGFLAHPEELDRFFDTVFSEVQMPVSVKTRLGIEDPEEFSKLLEIYNRYPIAMLIVHPRVQRQRYRGQVDLNAFAEALETCRMPVCYNGDLNTLEDIQALETRFPALRHGMLGRGAVADPALPRKLHGGPPATRQELQSFTQTLYREYQEFYGQIGTAAQRMREVWFYLIHLFENTEKLNRQMRRFRSPGDYEQIEAAIFQELPLRDHSEGALV